MVPRQRLLPRLLSFVLIGRWASKLAGVYIRIGREVFLRFPRLANGGLRFRNFASGLASRGWRCLGRRRAAKGLIRERATWTSLSSSARVRSLGLGCGITLRFGMRSPVCLGNEWI